VGAWAPQGSPVSPILFAIYTAELINRVEEYVLEAERLFYVDNLGWVATGSDVNDVLWRLERCAAKSIEWASRHGLHFVTAKTEVSLFTRRRGHSNHLRQQLTGKIRVGNVSIRFYTQVIRWLGLSIDTHLTFQEHHNRCIKRARAAEARLQKLNKTYRAVPESVRAIQVVCAQAVELYGSTLPWDPRKVHRRDDLQLLLN
jgi:hypothetical protein